MDLQRIAMVLEFDGRCFHGWQKQENADSVQDTIEKALRRIEGREVSTVAAGRTDAGVHAEAMLVHADVSHQRWSRSSRAYTQGLNQLMPSGLRITGVRAVAEDFHARFDCLERRYRYRIWNRSSPSAIYQWRHWWMPRQMNEEAMRAAAGHLIGKHDFSSFRASGCQAANAVRDVRGIEIFRHGYEYTIDIRAEAFLYHMVRNIVGSLVMVATGHRESEWVKHLLELRDRSQAGDTAPAHGLYFTDALYRDFSATELIGQE